jgi:IS5 family transposase
LYFFKKIKAKKRNTNQASFFFDFEDTIDQKHPLYILSNKVNWDLFEESFSSKYSKNMARPAKPIRLMVGLLILKHIRNISVVKSLLWQGLLVKRVS